MHRGRPEDAKHPWLVPLRVCTYNGRNVVLQASRADRTVADELGRGTYGTVVRAYVAGEPGSYVDSQRRECAVKIMSLGRRRGSGGISTDVLWEVTALRSMDHPCIVHLLHVGTVRTLCAHGHLLVVLVFPLLRGQTLWPLRALAPASVEKVATDILSALDHVHRRGIVHCDVKLSNVIASAAATAAATTCSTQQQQQQQQQPQQIGTSTLIDFGLCMREGVRRRADVVTYLYRDPRLYGAHGSLQSTFAVDWGVDMWAFGCILVELVCARTLFNMAPRYTGIRADGAAVVTSSSPGHSDDVLYESARAAHLRAHMQAEFAHIDERLADRMGRSPFLPLARACLDACVSRRPTAGAALKFMRSGVFTSTVVPRGVPVSAEADMHLPPDTPILVCSPASVHSVHVRTPDRWHRDVAVRALVDAVWQYVCVFDAPARRLLGARRADALRERTRKRAHRLSAHMVRPPERWSTFDVAWACVVTSMAIEWPLYVRTDGGAGDHRATWTNDNDHVNAPMYISSVCHGRRNRHAMMRAVLAASSWDIL